MQDYPLLDTIDSLEDFWRIPDEQLDQLASEMRSFMIDVVSETGGHLASSLGAVELIIALHRVFRNPKDKLIFDVGHQAYAHKILTGRRAEFSTLRQAQGISGFLKHSESPYDVFDVGHASTSISAALGFARAKAIRGGEESIVALIGDGALTGGLAYEALNDAGQSKLPLIIVLNDNDMSISNNVGAMNRYLSEMRASTPYQNLKRRTVRVLDSNRLGKWLSKRMERIKNRIKYFLLPNVLFEAMGFTYLGPIDGHNIPALNKVLRKARLMQRPVIIHAVTKKGKGYSFAESQPEKFHGVGPFYPITGELKRQASHASNSEVFGSHLVRLAEKEKRIVAITAAMPTGTGLVPFAQTFPDRYFDVGIAEEHAVTMAAGLAAGGLKPVVALYSTFLQRAYDQMLHDVCLQNLPVVFAIDRAGLVGEDGETHQGVYDIAYLSTLPNLEIYSPATQQELMHMLEYALSRNCPCAIRYPKGGLMQAVSGQPITAGKWEVLRPISTYTIIATGRMVEPALALAHKEDAGLINARTLAPLDYGLMDALKEHTKGIFTLEDGIVTGGMGQQIAAHFSESPIWVRSLGIPNHPIPQGPIVQQQEWCGLSPEQIQQSFSQFKEVSR